MVISALKRFAKELLLRTHPLLATVVPDKHSPYRFSGGRIYLNVKESRMMLARALGLYEVEKTKAIRVLLGSGSIFVDVGVNKGDFTLLAARIVGDSGKVIAFEPEPVNCHWIRKSIELNGYRNVTLYEAALSDSDGTAQLHLGEKSGWHTLLPERSSRNEGEITVITKKLDSVLEKREHKVDMLKIDVEGAELEVLKGAYKTLVNNRNVILLIDIHQQLGVNPKELCEFLTELDFKIYEMKFPFKTPACIDKHLHEILAHREGVNLDKLAT